MPRKYKWMSDEERHARIEADFKREQEAKEERRQRAWTNRIRATPTIVGQDLATAIMIAGRMRVPTSGSCSARISAM